MIEESKKLERKKASDARAARTSEFNRAAAVLEKRKADIEKEIRVVDGHLHTATEDKKSLELENYVQPDSKTHPDKIIADLNAKKKQLEREALNLKSENDSLHLERGKEIVADKNKAGAKYYEEVLGPRELHLSDAVAQLKGIFAGFVATIVGTQLSDDSGTAEDAEQIDANIAAFIESCDRYKVPGNYRLKEADKVGKAREENMQAGLRKFENTIKELTVDLQKRIEAARKKANPAQERLLTEGQRPSNWRRPRP